MALSLAAAFLFRRPAERVPPLAWNAALIILLLVTLAMALAPPRDFASVFHAIAYFLVYVTIIRLFTRRTGRDDLVLLLLAFLEVSAAGVMTISPAFLFSVFAFMVSALSSLTLFSLRGESEKLEENREDFELRLGRRPPSDTGSKASALERERLPSLFPVFPLASSLAILLAGALFFFVIPRVGRSFFSWRTGIHSRVAGFSDVVQLGSVGAIKRGNAMIMRVKIEGGAPSPLYLRGIAHDHYEGGRWSDKLGYKRIHYYGYGEAVSVRDINVDRGVIKQEITLEPIDHDFLFAAPMVESVSAPFQFRGIVEYWNGYIGFPLATPIYDRIVYTAWSSPPPQSIEACREAWASADDLGWLESHYLQVPSGADDIRELAEDVVSGESDPCQKAWKIRSFLSSEYYYDLDTPSDRAPDPVKDFLFESKRGYCEHFATSMALMLRSVGVPCRLAAGFLAGDDYNTIDKYYTVREKDAHTWVEMYAPGGDWFIMDPTPAGPPAKSLHPALRRLQETLEAFKYRWDRWVVDLSLRDQYQLALAVRQRGNMAGRRALQAPSEIASLVKSALSSPAAWAAVFLALGAYLVWVKRLGPALGKGKLEVGSNGRLAGEYAKLARRAEKEAGPRKSSETALELSRNLSRRSFSFADSFHRATVLYLKARYGGQPNEDEALESIKEASRRMGG